MGSSPPTVTEVEAARERCRAIPRIREKLQNLEREKAEIKESMNRAESQTELELYEFMLSEKEQKYQQEAAKLDTLVRAIWNIPHKGRKKMNEVCVSVRQMQSIEYNILKFIKDVCEKNHLCYYLAYGSLIGAVRHNGFIPWDDDIDILMPRIDYEKFVKAVEAEKHPYYKVISKETEENYTLPLPKVIDSRIELVENYCFIEKVVLGPYVDVFVLDGCGESEQQASNHFKTCYKIFKKWTIADTDYSKLENRFIALLKSILYFPIRKKGYESFLHDLSMECAAYSYEKSNYVGTLMYPSKNGDDKWSEFLGNVWPKKCFGEGIELAFGDEKFTVPVKMKLYYMSNFVCYT